MGHAALGLVCGTFPHPDRSLCPERWPVQAQTASSAYGRPGDVENVQGELPGWLPHQVTDKMIPMR
jgi:hypothetical protein